MNDTDTSPATEGNEIADFEGSLDELEALVERMETGELSLEESLQAFERGVALTRSCQQALKTAELRVQTLTERASEIQADADANVDADDSTDD